jgi:diguanylate cyclase (GGDEF)-like protein
VDDPGADAWSGGLVYLAMMTAGMAMAAGELWLPAPVESESRRTLLFAAGVLAVFYLCRCIAYVTEGPDAPLFRSYFGSEATSVLTIVLLVIVSFTMTALSSEQLITKLNEQASRDGLTGLLNRSAFLELASREILRLHATGSVCTLIFADLDHFKALNDNHGHAAGDAAIQAFAAACLASVRHIDLVGRYGGEEFVLLLPGADVASAEIITAKISSRLAEAASPTNVSFPTASYGIARGAGAVADLAGMIAAADQALYQAKALGRDRAVHAGPPPSA